MRDSSKAMEQHGSELNDQDQREEEHKDETNWLELEILLGDVNLNQLRKENFSKDSCELFSNSQQIIRLMRV